MSFDAARAIFNQADTNRDGAIDRNEFTRWAGNGVVSGAGLGGASSWESSSYNSSGYGADAGLASAGLASAGLAGAGYGGSSFESAAYESAGYGAGAGAGYGAGYGVVVGAGDQAFNAASQFGTQTAVQTYATDAQGLFLDSNPQIIRRAAATGPQTYTQNIRVRFLQPPPVPPHGPLIIREVRPPQPPAPLPLRIRQQAPPLPTPPPLVLRERPPQAPGVIASQTVIRRLAALPVPPRSVIIERLPPLPPRPRDIIMERWVPYAPQAKRRTILQRAGPAIQYARPRNVIIQYEPAQVRVVRQFQRLGVTPASPAAYVQQYGLSLLDAATLVQQARSAGVVEDISPPGGYAVGYSAATYGQDLSGGAFGSSGFVSGYGGGFDGGLVGGASSYESYGDDLGYSGLVGGGGFESSSSYESSSYGGVGGGFDAVGAAFRGVDTNRDGRIDRNEFNRFYQQGL